MARPYRINYNLDPKEDSVSRIKQENMRKQQEAAALESSNTASAPTRSISPFDLMSDKRPNQELAIIAFPIQTYEAISNEAVKRGLTFAEAVQQAFNNWVLGNNR